MRAHTPPSVGAHARNLSASALCPRVTGTEEWEAALELTVKPRFNGVVKVVLPYQGGSGEFAVVTDHRLFDVYVPGVFVKEWGIQRKDRVTGDMEPSNNARNPWKVLTTPALDPARAHIAGPRPPRWTPLRSTVARRWNK